jgi:chromosome segregation protein
MMLHEFHINIYHLQPIKNMYLKRIEIKGFKSFAKETIFDFTPQCTISGGIDKGCGITAIVGPNGSGKSNISDAVRWVMGEQSMKSLRGKKSDDVIFSGSDKKSRMSMARVSLIFDNSDKMMPIEYDEVVISRVLYRDGESEYLINDAHVRLLDIVDLLARVGIGRESYSVVGQGMTDAILNATSLERRSIIEDAAGVKHFQIQKLRALKKLDRTKDNLEQVQALIAEVTPHVRSLKRQANKARQSKDIHQQYKNAQKTYFSQMWHILQKERSQHEQERQRVGIELKNAERDIDRLSDQIMIESKKVDDTQKIEEYEKQKRAAYVQMQSLEKKIAVAEGHIEIQKERRSHEKKIVSIPVDLIYIQKKLDAIRTRQNSLVIALEKVEDVAQIQEIIVAFKEIHKEVESLYDDAGKKHVDVVQDDYDVRVQQYDEKITELTVEVTEHTKELDHIRKEIDTLDRSIGAVVAADKQARMTFFTLEKELRERQRVMDAIRDQFNEIKVSIARIEVREEDVIAETRQELGVELRDIVNENTFDAGVDVAELERTMLSLRNKYEQVGGIDPLVIEEYEEMQERFDVLVNESEDLIQAIGQLKEVIKEMDEKIHAAFITAYKTINTEFTKYFRILFNGGNAKLTKVTVDVTPRKARDDLAFEKDVMLSENEESVQIKEGRTKNEMGIEIIASPPGKKIKHLSLLSGGERSLTSIAMLLAIIAYNPPPFTILDEVEAALDEANSRRLAKIFAELSHKTQFIIITHNRETMRHADMMYGITMGDDGASQLLSVKLDQITQNGDIENK